jgi:hypothetical protein
MEYPVSGYVGTLILCGQCSSCCTYTLYDISHVLNMDKAKVARPSRMKLSRSRVPSGITSSYRADHGEVPLFTLHTELFWRVSARSSVESLTWQLCQLRSTLMYEMLSGQQTYTNVPRPNQKKTSSQVGADIPISSVHTNNKKLRNHPLKSQKITPFPHIESSTKQMHCRHHYPCHHHHSSP